VTLVWKFQVRDPPPPLSSFSSSSPHPLPSFPT
jgi:hypothetical protein